MRFSVIVALAPGRKAEVLQSLKKLNYDPAKYEVIIETGKSASSNRNKGVQAAQGEIIAFVDDDAYVDQDWLKNADAFFAKYQNINVVGGPQLTPENDGLFGKISGFALSSVFGGASIRNRYRKAELNLKSNERELTSANLFCQKTIFEKIMFNPNMWPGEDPEFFNECLEKNIRLAYSPDIIIYHKRRKDLLTFAKQIFTYAYVRPMVRKTKKTGRTSILFLVPSIFLIYLLLLPFLSVLTKLFLLPLYAYVVLNIMVTVVAAVNQKNVWALLFLPVTFLTLHLSYGSGFICGTLKKKWQSRLSVL
jgi:succinoglycan biosynthesis protein ExoA